MNIHDWFGVEKNEKDIDNTIDIDGIRLQVESITDNMVKGKNLTDDGEKPICFVKEGNIVATGRNERAARLSLNKKIFMSKSEDQRISEFVEKYGPNDLHTTDEWIVAHQALTGSCNVGSYRFIKSQGIKRYEKYTTIQFLNIVSSIYSSELISKVRDYYNL